MPMRRSPDNRNTIQLPALKLWRDDLQEIFDRIHKVCGDVDLRVNIRSVSFEVDSPADLAEGHAPRLDDVRMSSPDGAFHLELAANRFGASNISYTSDSLEMRGLAVELAEGLREHRRILDGFRIAGLLCGLAAVALGVAAAYSSVLVFLLACFVAAPAIAFWVPPSKPSTFLYTSARAERPSWWEEHRSAVGLSAVVATITAIITATITTLAKRL